MTGELDENIIREIESKLDYIRNLENRKQEVIRLIDEQEKLTTELEEKIKKQKSSKKLRTFIDHIGLKKNKSISCERKGLEPLANIILHDKTEEELINFALSFVDEEKDILSVDDAIKGAQDIIASGFLMMHNIGRL